MINENFIYKLIQHIKDYGYWVDCSIYYGNKIFSSYDVSYFDKESATLIEEKKDVYVLSTNSYYKDLEIVLLERQGGLLYYDAENPLLCDLPRNVKQYMIDHQNMYYIKNFAMADGRVALFALEKFLYEFGSIIIEWKIDEYIDRIIIADITLDSILKRDHGFARFKKAIGYNY